MSTLLKIAFALSCVGLLACGGADQGDAAIARMAAISKRMCACQDVACATGVMKELSAMPAGSGALSKAQMDKAMKVAATIVECQKKFMDAPAPKPTVVPPPVPPTAEAAAPAVVPAAPVAPAAPTNP